MPPLLTPRTIQVHRLLRHWSRAGHDVHVVCAEPDTAPCPAHDHELSGPGEPGYHVHQVPSPEAAHVARFRRLFPHRGWRRRAALYVWGRLLSLPDPQRYWVRAAAREVCRLIRRSSFDILITFGNPMSDHLVGLMAKRTTGIRWLAHFSDPWVDNAYRSLPPAVRHVNRLLERSVAAKADHAVFVSDATRRLVTRKYPCPWRRRSRTIPHYFGGVDLPAPDPSSSPMVFRHIGTFYGHRTPEPLFAAIEVLKRRDPTLLDEVTFEMIGPTYPPSLMPGWLSAFDLPQGVSSREPVPHRESLSLMASSHVLISFDADADGSNVFLPSKLVDYLGANRPLLGITPPVGPSADLIQKANGLVVAPDDVDGIERALVTLVQEFRSGDLFRKRTPPQDVRASYDLGTVAPMFEALFRPEPEIAL